ncbi:MAG: 3-deoxy-D-manno-octulosonic acid transferase [Ignavibacteriales bacterium]|nr:3-deoxy-D-manno-octulosonic acid transferase [Ignavibacteriales bacterium]
MFIPAFTTVMYVIAAFNKKAARGIKGRERLFEDLLLKAGTLDKGRPLVWIHSASLGEFEQAKPIIETLKNNYPVNVLVTFFSPSGYDNAKNYPLADITSYIPLDSRSQAKRFIDICNPAAVIFIRYDVWPNHVYYAYKKNIPIFLVSATLRPNSLRKKGLFALFHRSLFGMFRGIITISEEDKRNFLDVMPHKELVSVAGDTRFDRVFKMSQAAKNRNLIKPEVLEGKKVFVAGSTWEEDEDALFPALLTLNKYEHNALYIIVPHEPHVSHIEHVEGYFNIAGIRTIRFSDLNQYKGETVIIVDSIGILLTLYSYAHIAFVGGSFKANVHNVLEAAVYGIPVFYGPKIGNSREAFDLANTGGGIICKNKKDCYRTIRELLSNEPERIKRGKIAKDFIVNHTGATEKIMDTIIPAITYHSGTGLFLKNQNAAGN